MAGPRVESSVAGSGGFRDFRGLRTFLSLYDLELDAITFLERLEPRPLDGAVMDEDVRATLAGDEAVSLRVVEPFDRTLSHF